MRCWRAAWLLVLSGLLAQAQASSREGWEGTLPERFFETFMEFYRDDPSALARYPGGLRNISADQLHRAIIGLDTTHFTYLYPMTIRGHELPQVHGTPTRRLSLMAVRGGKLIPIPFQIDEFDRTGLIWIPGANKAPAEGKPDFLDDFDEVAAGLGNERGIGGHAVQKARLGQFADFGDIGSIDKEFHAAFLFGLSFRRARP